MVTLRVTARALTQVTTLHSEAVIRAAFIGCIFFAYALFCIYQHCIFLPFYYPVDNVRSLCYFLRQILALTTGKSFVSLATLAIYYLFPAHLQMSWTMQNLS